LRRLLEYLLELFIRECGESSGNAAQKPESSDKQREIYELDVEAVE